MITHFHLQREFLGDSEERNGVFNQVGYMYINHNTPGIGSDYIYNSFCGRISCEITYRINQFQVGLLTHLVMGYGQTKEFIYMQPSYRYSFGFMGGVGILLKFSL